MSVWDEVYDGQSGSSDPWDEAYGGKTDPWAEAYAPDEGEIRNSSATWGDVGSFFSKLGQGPMGVDERALDYIREGGLSGNSDRPAPEILTPQERDAALGTVVPAAVVAEGMLLGNPVAGVGLKPFLARAAQNMALGGVARASTATARGEKVSDAVMDPVGAGIDVAMAGLPEVWAGTKATGRAIRSLTPDPVAEPIGRVASTIASKAASAGDRLLMRIAERYPRVGARLVDDSMGLSLDAAIHDRPPIAEPDYSTLRTEWQQGLSEPTGRTGMEALKEAAWQGPIRHLMNSDDPVARAAGQMAARRNNMADTIHQMTVPRAEKAVSAIAEGDESAAIANALNEGRSVHITARGLPGEPDIAGKARPIRDLFNDFGDQRTGVVWDRVPPWRFKELQELNLDSVRTGKGRYYAPAERVRQGGYWAKRAVSDPTDAANELSDIERYMSEEGTTAEQAMQMLRRTGASAGLARTGEMTDFSRSVHDVVPDYARDQANQIANATVFGGKPVRLTIKNETGVHDIDVGEKMGAIYKHLIYSGKHADARQLGNYLVDVYGANSNYGSGWMREVARKTSDMALSHSALTQMGQMQTPIWASGGPRQIARGYAMVRNNPLLKEVFDAGPRRLDMSEYISLARGGEAENTLLGPGQTVRGIENFLRGPNSYAAVPFIDDIVQEGVQAVQNGQPFSAALIKRAAEAGTTPDALVSEYMRNGTLSPGTWLDGIQTLVKRWQYSTAAGEIPHLMRTPAGAALTMYKGYGIKASQHVIDDIFSLLRSDDASLRALGRQRFKDLALYGVLTTNPAVGAVKAVARGRAPHLGSLVRAAGGPLGIMGDSAGAVAQAMDPNYGDHPVADFFETPAISVPATAAEDILAVGADPTRALVGASRAAGLIDPRIPMYSAPIVGAIRSFAK